MKLEPQMVRKKQEESMERKVGRNEIYSTTFDQRGDVDFGILHTVAELHPNPHSWQKDICVHRYSASCNGYAPPHQPVFYNTIAAFRQWTLGSGHESR